MPLSTRISNNLIIDSNLIETAVEEEEENGQNAEVSNEEGSDAMPLTPTTPSSRQTRLAKLFQERRRIVGRTVSESQLLAKPVANGTEKSKEAEDTPDFYEHRAKDLLPYKGGEGLTHKFLEEILKINLEYIDDTFDRGSRVLEFHHPHDLKEKLHLEIPEKPENLDQILDDCRKTLQYCVKTGHPRFFNQLSTGLDIVSLAGHWVTTTANTNMFTYEIAPVFTLVEKATLKKMREFIGYTDGDGIFCPGGAISNLYAVLTARHKLFPSCKRRGLNNLPTLVMFTSEHSHFSLRRAAAIAGIGTDNVTFINTDQRGKIDLEDLENKIQQTIARGDKPFFVSATAGTTVVGAFDPINAIADICEKYKLWLHVDAAWGGGVILSRKYKHLVDGLHRADSVTWNPHKMMGVTLQCSAILLKEDGLLEDCNSMRATYLFQQDKHYDVCFDTGDKAIQCGRTVDVFRLWLMWRAKGTKGIESQINKLFDLAHYLVDRVRSKDAFQLVFEKPECTNVCFWYYPPSIRELEDTQEKQLRLHKVAPIIKARLMNEGRLMVGYQPLNDKVNFFRWVVSNPAASKHDVDYMLDEIERLGHDL
ncbi:glutamate decarboxylase-like isoform X2 [Apostichopus japonicus]|uniref:glutamate decarboxylase-like isoform X2 n=1 Tax=Stichopus japonicus TaxID=307972 RepID=UPI003AB19633